jgi:hypothetical protein
MTDTQFTVIPSCYEGKSAALAVPAEQSCRWFDIWSPVDFCSKVRLYPIHNVPLAVELASSVWM